MNWKKNAQKYFIECKPAEGCGFLAEKNGDEFFYPCKNLASYLEDEITFAIDPLDYAACEDSGAKILAIIHSHVEGNADPSEADIKNCKLYMTNWYI